MQAHEIRRRMCPSYEQASHEAEEHFDAKTQMMFHVTVYQQGDREHILASLSMKDVADISTNRRTSDDGSAYNRTPSMTHVKGIKEYLISQVSRRKTYILPPITMAIGEGECVPMTLYLTNSATRGSKIGVLVMKRPFSDQERFPILDGQHRILAIKDLISEGQDPSCDPIIAEIPNDYIQMILVNETDVGQIHTDFVNLACTKPITKGLKVSWDKNNRLSMLSLVIASEALRSKVELESTVAKQGSLLTISQVMLSVAELASGKSGLKAQKMISEELRRPERHDELYQLSDLFFETLRQATEASIGQAIDDYERFRDHRRASLLLIGSVVQTVARAVFKLCPRPYDMERCREVIEFFFAQDFDRYEPVPFQGELLVNESSPFFPDLLTSSGTVMNSYSSIEVASDQLVKLWLNAHSEG